MQIYCGLIKLLPSTRTQVNWIRFCKHFHVKKAHRIHVKDNFWAEMSLCAVMYQSGHLSKHAVIDFSLCSGISHVLCCRVLSSAAAHSRLLHGEDFLTLLQFGFFELCTKSVYTHNTWKLWKFQTPRPALLSVVNYQRTCSEPMTIPSLDIKALISLIHNKYSRT